MGAGRDPQRSPTQEPAVDGVTGDRLLERIEVLDPEPMQVVVLLGPAGPAVRLAVRQRRLTETAVASRGVLGDPVLLEQQHAGPRLALDGTERRPEPAEPTAHDDKVDRRVAGDSRSRVRPQRRVEPERPVDRSGE
jgi:hypothetical protein